MKIRWYHLALCAIPLCLVGTFLLLWTPTTKETPTVSSTSNIEADTAIVNLSQEQTEDDPFVLKNLSNVLSFEELAKLYPDAPLVAAFHSMFTDEDRDAMDADAKKAYEIIASGEFFDFFATKPTTKEFDRWWAERGFFYDPERFKKAFREYFPDGEPEDYEPEMRAKYAALFEGITAENEIDMVFANAAKFITDSRNQAWIKGYFNREGIGREETLTAWTSGIRQQLIHGDTSNDETIHGSDPVEFAIPSESDGFSQGETNGLSQETPPPDANTFIDVESADISEDSFPFDDLLQKDPETITLETLEALESVGLPTEENIESQLRKQLNPERFSPQRLNKAMQTLNQYGPEEGVRRLRESDPEIAEVVERRIGAPKEPSQ
ncbi:MAG: hypothetical protein OXH00_02260 [Candidatus Poribacteria bacterium]|nr:hypothetical protein [Candidatus Poribacteria bacterium]